MRFHKSSEMVDNPNPKVDVLYNPILGQSECVMSSFVQSWMAIFRNWKVSLITGLENGMEWWNEKI